MAAKKPNPFLEKKEEKLGKDLDNDKEKGESAAHKAKVLGAPAKAGKTAMVKCPKCGAMHPIGHIHLVSKK